MPLVGITVMQRLGRVCIVELYPGIERAIPVAATSRAEVVVALAGCKLSLAGLQALFAVVASLTAPCQEDTHGEIGAVPAKPAAPTAPALTAHRIWRTLAPADRVRARLAILHVIQEVLNDRHRP